MSRELQSSQRNEVVLLPEDVELLHGRFPNDRERNDRRIVQLRVLWSHRRFLLRVTVVGVILSAILAFLIPPRYTSTVRLMPPDNGGSSGLATVAAALSGHGEGLTDIAGDVLGLKSNSDVFVGILGSRTAQDALVSQFDLMKVYGDRRLEDARKELAEKTNVSVDRKSQIISIAVSDRSPSRAAAIAQAYVQQLDRLVAQLNTSTAHRERVFLEGRLQQVQQSLEKAEKDFSQFASKNTAVDLKEQGKAMVDAAAEVQGELIATRSELEGMRQIYSDNNIRIRTLAARVATLEQQLEKLGGTGEASPAGSTASSYPSIRQLPLLGVPYADLLRQTAVQSAVFETLTKEYEMAKVQEAKETPSVLVLDTADLPSRKSFPPRGFIILMGTTFAIICGIAWVFAAAFWESMGSTDSRKVFAEEVYGTMRGTLTVPPPRERSSSQGED